MAASYTHNSLAGPVHRDRRLKCICLGSYGRRNWWFIMSKFMQEKDCFFLKCGTISWPGGNSWACPLTPPLSVNDSNTNMSTSDMSDPRPLALACIVGMCSNCHVLPTRLFFTLNMFWFSGSMFDEVCIEQGLFASRAVYVTGYLRTSWDSIFLSFQLNDLIYICLALLTC